MSAVRPGGPIEILMVEDNAGDVRLAREALKNGRLTSHLTVAEDGYKALDLLRREREALPDLILLDLNMPHKNGYEVLAEVKEDEILRRIPVIVLTTSQDRQDIIRAYNLHANCYIVKPFDFEQFVQVVRMIEDFWTRTVYLPAR